MCLGLSSYWLAGRNPLKLKMLSWLIQKRWIVKMLFGILSSRLRKELEISRKSKIYEEEIW